MFYSRSLGLALLPLVAAVVHDVQVGESGLNFTPEALAANPGDQVVFHFHAKNHTVTQSSFANPCSLKDGGFNSGFTPVAANLTTNLPTFTITVNDTTPIWVFCDQAANTPNSHCGQGMIFAVNCPPDGSANSFDNFKKSALAIGAALAADASGDASGVTTAAYGGLTIPAAPTATLVTATIDLQASTWTTTYSSYPGSPDATPDALQGTVHKVIVGGSSGLVFDPPHLAAAPRDIISFEFHQKNHTVTQSSFADPCRPLNANGTTGFNSGFMFVDPNATTFPVFNVTVNTTSPIWAYCEQTNPASHCGSGMVFAINSVETSDRNFSAFQNIAKALNGSTSSNSSGTNTGKNLATTTLPHGKAALALVLAGVIASLF